jgi:DNA invertase Pin-like site-specific DNA recombinase
MRAMNIQLNRETALPTDLAAAGLFEIDADVLAAIARAEAELQVARLHAAIDGQPAPGDRIGGTAGMAHKLGMAETSFVESVQRLAAAGLLELQVVEVDR